MIMSVSNYSLNTVSTKLNMSIQDLIASVHEVNVFTRIMESDDSDVINEIANYLEKAFHKRERLLL